MTDVQEELISQEIIDEDLDLRGDINSADRTFKSAKERRAEAYAALNQYRWEMCECPYGPRFSHRVYGPAVGVAQSTISRGVAAWQAVVDGELMHDASVCNYGSVPHHVPDAAPAEGTGPTEAQTEKHTETAKKATASELRIVAIEELATRFGLAFDTIKSRTGLIKDAMSRLSEYEIEGLSIEQVRPTLATIALEIHQEHKLRAAREGDVLRWMAKNRGVDTKDIKDSDVHSMYTRIERVMERKSYSWQEAEAEVKASDEQRSEAERIKNDLARKARLAILDLQQASARLHQHALVMIKCVDRLKAEKIPLSDDEKSMSLDDLDAALAAIQLARVALTGGDSGADWDSELESLLNKEGGSAA